MRGQIGKAGGGRTDAGSRAGRAGECGPGGYRVGTALEGASLVQAVLVLDGTSLTCGRVAAAARGQVRVELAADGRERARVAAKVAARVSARREVYGRTTGVGANRGFAVAGDDLADHGLRPIPVPPGPARPPLPP